MLDFMLINLIFKFQHICSGIGKSLSQSDVAQKKSMDSGPSAVTHVLFTQNRNAKLRLFCQ